MFLERQAVRAILLTPQQEILLLRLRAPQGGDWFWITPGGGLEPGESVEAGLRRELREELGLEHFSIGPLVWRRQHTFNWGEQRICQREQYHVVEVDRFDPFMSDLVEAQVVNCMRWWPIAELARFTEALTPKQLPTLITRYLREGPPSGPIELEVSAE
jgi:8-oxo-dGTP pyrophosphatase MutT (NUDIX family)